MSIKNFLHQLNRKDQTIISKPKFFKFAVLILTILTLVNFSRAVLAQTQTASALLNYKTATLGTASPNRTLFNDGSLQNDFLTSLVDLIWNIKGQADDLLNGNFIDDNGNTLNWVPGGAIGGTTQMIGYLYQKPASGVEYIASSFDNFLGKPAYAQGAGFTGLQPLLPVWRGFRNVVYLLSSIVIIIIGLMVVLRVKISPQAVITIQAAIPQVITTLILVSFSYAIAGLLIDLSYIIQGVAISAMFSALGVGSADSIIQPGLGQSLMSALSGLFGGSYTAYNLSDLVQNNGFLQTFDLTSRLVPTTFIALLSFIIGGIAGFFFSGGFGSPITAGAGLLIGGGGFTALMLLIIGVVVLIKLIGFLFSLISVYINVLLKVILAPFEIGMGAFPGSKAGFSNWIWDLIANLAVFPFVLIFLVFSNVIMERIQGGGLWTPSIMGVAGAAFGGRLIAALFGIGSFILLSKLPEMIPQVIFSLKPSPWGSAIGKSVMLENIPVIGGLYKNSKAAADKGIQGAVGTGFGWAASKAGLTKAPQQPESN